MKPTREQIMELRRLIVNIKNPTTFNGYFMEVLRSDINISSEMLAELLQPCWGHNLMNDNTAANIDVIDGPEKDHKINCNTCIHLLVMNKEIL